MKLTLPYPPSSNRYWRKKNTGKIYLSAEAVKYREDTAKASAGFAPLDGDIAVTMQLFRPQKSGDLDNRIKIMLDAMQTHLFHDDKQVVEIHAYRFDDKANPRVEVEITNKF